MREYLVRFYGASDEDLRRLQHSCDFAPADPTLPFRRSMTARIAMDLDAGRARRLQKSGFVLDSSEGFNRHDSGAIRNFDETPDTEVVKNSAYQALIRFKADMMRVVPTMVRSRCDPEHEEFLMTAFHLRTITTKDLMGEPAAEGTHMDGVEYTMTTMLNSTNMSTSSAISRLHTLEQQAGVPWHETEPKFLIGRCQHRSFLDTLLLADADMQHSVSELHQEDEEKAAVRDMLVLFTRHPALHGAGHPSERFDNMASHHSGTRWTLPSARGAPLATPL